MSLFLVDVSELAAPRPLASESLAQAEDLRIGCPYRRTCINHLQRQDSLPLLVELQDHVCVLLSMLAVDIFTQIARCSKVLLD